MRNVARILGVLMLAIGLMAAVSATSSAKKGRTVTNPAADSVHAAILGGLRLVKKGDFDGWVNTYCDKANLCYNSNAIRTLKKYNLPELQRRSSNCLKDGGKSIFVTKEQEKPGGGVKLFLQCNPKGMPRPFHLLKTGTKWLWTNV